ncbi:hypothetical protein ACFQFH_02550 [Halobaculum halobium]
MDSSGENRYGHLSIADDSVIIYDRDRVDAWIQSTVAHEVPPQEPTPEPYHVDSGNRGDETGGD